MTAQASESSVPGESSSAQLSGAQDAPDSWGPVRVYLPPNTAGPSRLPPLHDEPKPTPAEIKEAFASHIQQRHGPDAPLMTSAMRAREEERLGIKKREYNECRIRIRFSDRTTIETTLPGSMQISDVYKFLRAQLDPAHPAANTAFILYQSPPRRDFPERTKDPKLNGKTLKELGMAPQAALNIRWQVDGMNANTYPAPLSADLKATAEPLPSPPVFDGSQASGQAGASSTSNTQGSSSEAKKTIPKWLKGLQKK